MRVIPLYLLPSEGASQSQLHAAHLSLLVMFHELK